jgi:hypothetical protein
MIEDSAEIRWTASRKARIFSSEIAETLNAGTEDNENWSRSLTESLPRVLLVHCKYRSLR